MLEVLVSIALFAVIAAGIASTMSQMTKLTKKLKSKEASVLSAQIAVDRLQRDLQMAYNENVQKTPSIFKATEVGAGPELTFSFFDSDIKVLFRNRTPGVMLAHYFSEKDENGTIKILRADGPLYLADKINDQPAAILATGVLNWKVEFYDSKNDNWQSSWDTASPSSAGNFPRAIRLKLETIDPDLPKDEWKSKNLKISTEFLILNESETRIIQ